MAAPARLGAACVPVAVLVALAAGCGGGGPHVNRPPSTTQPTTAPTAPRPAAGEVASLRVASVSPFSATIAWESGSPIASSVEAGPPDGPPTLWRRETRPVTRHSLTLSGLSPSTPYSVRVGTSGAGGSVDLTTGPPPSHPWASAREGVLWIDGNPFFPLMVFEQCPDTYSTSLQVGIDLFAGNRCGGLAEQRPALAGKALVAVTADDHAASARGTVGSFYPDEADGHELTAAKLPQPPRGGAGVRFLTLTNHFYSGAAPLANGRTIYPGLVSKADMVGFDLYPLQGWCSPGRLADVYYAQRELAQQLARGKPTYQWIEAAGMRCPDGPTAVTPATTRAESFLAIAGGARGLGYFPAAAWTGDVGAAISGVSRAVRYLGPGLLGPDVPTTIAPASGPVLAGGRAFDGALYVVAVNSSLSPARATITVPGLAGRPLQVFDEGRSIAAQGDAFTDDFAPLAAHVYVAEPAAH